MTSETGGLPINDYLVTTASGRETSVSEGNMLMAARAAYDMGHIPVSVRYAGAYEPIPGSREHLASPDFQLYLDRWSQRRTIERRDRGIASPAKVRP